MEVLVSVIIPTFNRERILSQAIDSVINQTYQNWECIVVDDGSEDNTIDLLRRYSEKDSRIRFYKRDRLPKGAPTSRNIGLKHANGDYVIFLDSDDYLLPFCIEQRIKEMVSNDRFLFGVFPMATKIEDAIIKQDIDKDCNYLHKFLSADLPWSIMCPVWRTDFLNSLEGFTEGYPRFNDPELMIRALLRVDDTQYGVFWQSEYDTVHIPSVKTSVDFTENVYKSLKLFIPDTVKELETYQSKDLKPLLSGYLYIWVKYFYIPSKQRSFSMPLKLITLFYKNGIISLLRALSLIIRFFVFNISDKILKSPIDKLSPRYIYLKDN